VIVPIPRRTHAAAMVPQIGGIGRPCKIKADDAECQSYGIKPDSDACVQCRLAIDVTNSEAAAEAARRQQARTRP
jgi:hypothetical protein